MRDAKRSSFYRCHRRRRNNHHKKIGARSAAFAAWLCLVLALIIGTLIGFRLMAGVSTLGFKRGGLFPKRHSLSDAASGDHSVTSNVIDFGQITPGGLARMSFLLANESDSAMEVATIRTNCECLSVGLSDRLIGPHGAVTVQATIDLADDREFSGGLCPEAEFLDASGESLFIRTFRAKVRGRTRPSK